MDSWSSTNGLATMELLSLIDWTRTSRALKYISLPAAHVHPWWTSPGSSCCNDAVRVRCSSTIAFCAARRCCDDDTIGRCAQAIVAQLQRAHTEGHYSTLLLFAGSRFYLMVDGAVHMHRDFFQTPIRSYLAQLDAPCGYMACAPWSAAEGTA